MAALPGRVEAFADEQRHVPARQTARRVVAQFLSYLRNEGLIPAARSPRMRFFKCVLEYEQFLRDERGFPEETISGIKAYCLKFLKYIHGAGVAKLRLLKRQTIQDFVITEGPQYCRQTMISYCSILRNFLSFLFTCRRIPRDHSSVVITPRTYRHERCPRYLTKSEIEKVLGAADRATPVGKRDFAILSLLATYGLRGIEVVRLSLDDVDWQCETLHIRRRKVGNSCVYPLAASVAETLALYLKEGRPQTLHREIFVTPHAPFRPIRTVAIRHIVKKYLRRAGLDVQGAGAHTFRYSCAQRLFEEDFSLKMIGDYLGHRELGTTQRYVKIDLKSLREVATNDGEDIP
jgi:site-specific recombinase XerD